MDNYNEKNCNPCWEPDCCCDKHDKGFWRECWKDKEILHKSIVECETFRICKCKEWDSNKFDCDRDKHDFCDEKHDFYDEKNDYRNEKNDYRGEKNDYRGEKNDFYDKRRRCCCCRRRCCC